MGTATSASRVCSAPASTSLCTATERMPMARSVRITRTAISPRLATRTVSNTYAPRPTTALSVPKAPTARGAFGTESSRLHAEDAIADLLQRCVGAGRQGESQHRAGLCGVDDAVVPQPRRRVVRMPLALVLLADRRLERFLVLRRPLLAARLEPVTADLGEHAGRLLAAHDRDARVG